ncbi:hypothetical protein JY651_11685 [Pyxidicoccus parkwayensis]|uniref:Uncharacterized protein n=1 Tax=Pyxidicoccus parkwayensis TaxID=2813578 RepID=A0ABX7P539_9BACT|nr:hypothetical protein [Pyxidicoccus parkwaysis]QSQ25546.1 hypothetical protein JY651_11685 [Pyxidicoccus parkwaysis]
MKTITWKCTAGAGWQWLSGSPGTPGFPTTGDGERSGTITLPPNPNYWYPCISLVLQGQSIGNAYLRYFQDGNVDKVQAIAVAQGSWIEYGPVDTQTSQTNASGGINLLVNLM